MTTLPDEGEVFAERYQLHEVLGEGGFARVFRATDIELGRDVAIKVLKPSTEPGRDNAAERFLKEMKLVAAVRDRHVVTLFDYGRQPDGVMFMVLELVGGRDLDEILAEGPLSEDEAIAVMRQVLAALRAAHLAGTLHRDVKPANIRVFEYMGDPWRVKLLDFGIAKTLVDDVSLTATGMAVGTPRFMTPEQLFGEDLGPTTDLYSLAVVTYEMLTAEPLHHMRRLANEDTVSITTDRIGEPLRRILNRMLERHPAQRFPNADAVLTALDNLETAETRPPSLPADLDDHPTVETIAEPGRHRASTTQLEHPEAPASTSTTVGVTSSRLASLSVLAVLTGAGAGLAILALFSRESTPEPAPTAIVTPTTTRAALTPSVEPVAEPVPEYAQVDAGKRGPPSGCGKRPPHQGSRTLDTTDGLRRVRWRVHIPAGYDPNVPHPAVLLFHDDASKPQNVIDKTSLDDTADAHGFVIIAPRDPAFAPVWTSDALDDARIAFEQTAAELCLDRDRVFAVGHGSGGNAVARLTCQDWIRGFALAAFALETPTFRCAPARPAPLVWFAPLNTGFLPPAGGADCARGTRISFDEYEAMWRARNQTTEKAVVLHDTPGGACQRWDGVAPFMSCRVHGGRPWPGAPPRATDLLDCDGEAPDFDFNEVLWSFFSSLD